MATVQESSAHWGTFRVEVADDGRTVTAARPHPDEPDAAPAIGNVAAAQHHPSRVRRPAVRRRWLERGPGADPRRGAPDDEYVERDWDEVLDLVAAELSRVREQHGNAAIFGGSYGWGSAGRLHHAQSQLHRFLNAIGGYTASVNDYSRGASLVLLPHLIGRDGMAELRARPTSWQQIAEHTDLFLAFGGLRRSNGWVVPGGHDRHTASDHARRAAASTRIVSLSAQRDDVLPELGAEWVGARPGTDAAVLLAMVHTLVVEGLADDEFLARCTVGADRVRAYVRGELDGEEKTPEWAAALSGVPASTIRALARRAASGRTLVNVTYSLQRHVGGEQAVFAALTLAAFLGQIGLPGGGFSHGYGSMGDYGNGFEPVPLPTLDQGRNPVSDVIPCARISDLLLHPGERIPYDGGSLTLPDIRLVYWAGGNPFHHHQDLRRLERAFARVDTLIVHEFHWTPTARHADIVLPAANPLEREDVAAGPGDARLRVMPRIVPPAGEAREEFWIYDRLARRLGADVAEGRSSRAWLERIYEQWRERVGVAGAPPFAQFWAEGGTPLPRVPYADPAFARFRADPEASPLGTPSGRIELFSRTLDSFALPDVAGHAVWPAAAPADPEHDLELLCTQPSHRLHSQLDMGEASQSTKVAGREAIRLNPEDAVARAVADGDVVRVRSAQGSILAGVVVTDALLKGVAQMHTGAWFDPSAPEIADCVNGNVNVLTRDVGTSTLTQASNGARVRVSVARYDGPLPPIRAYGPPVIAD
ncbi:molybdopterin-dependent oxidoreductase [Microbacterium sp. SORGH_AS_0888]|uniref:molybdopterin-dependent oxidoreductase n=1 Tax=Microbacterium sp. SORGH_AS_0888 TaxID=3041791 RepID=UPI00277F0958|nr:molybdopterin-dependent oxidoreductase [Microbacterium sp. SORGH_AS_0888]MDQ1130534.1 biotin/methionine sulfoxide reductase [Microbacterium sp. SORGH_AS_0888]